MDTKFNLVLLSSPSSNFALLKYGRYPFATTDLSFFAYK